MTRPPSVQREPEGAKPSGNASQPATSADADADDHTLLSREPASETPRDLTKHHEPSSAPPPAVGARGIGRSVLVIAGLLAVLAIVAALRLIVGEPPPLTADGRLDRELLGLYLEIRRDRLLIGLTVGAALGVSGTLLQSLLRNPLASPYILGLSSGAALGYIIALAGYLPWALAISTPAAALGGAVFTMLAVYLLAQRRGRIDPVGLLLVGVIVNAINAAAIMFINYLNPAHVRSDMMRWMMGYLDDNVSLRMIQIIAVVTVAGAAIAFMLGRAMDVATFGDSEAHALGLRMGRLRLLLFVTAGVLTAGAVMLAGPIGFVGLISPHIVRLLAGPGHRTVILGAAIVGGVIVVGADAAIKYVDTLANIGMMPIGVLTAIIGGPVFLILLRSQLGRAMT